MKVLSLQQPWASLIAAGIKDVENRTWQPREIPERILIHASKKCSLRTISCEPIEWVQEILNLQMMGDLPDFPDMPSNAIIGYFSIDRIDKKINGSLWASGEDDDEKLYYWHVKDCYLFDNPILDVKGKLWLWDYDLDENNLPPAHKVQIKGPKDMGEELLMPVYEPRWKQLGENQEQYFDLGISTSNILCQEDVYDLKPFKYIVFSCNGEKRKFRLTNQTETVTLIDDNNEREVYFSLLNPDGEYRWMAHLVWAEEIK